MCSLSSADSKSWCAVAGGGHHDVPASHEGDDEGPRFSRSSSSALSQSSVQPLRQVVSGGKLDESAHFGTGQYHETGHAGVQARNPSSCFVVIRFIR